MHLVCPNNHSSTMQNANKYGNVIDAKFHLHVIDDNKDCTIIHDGCNDK